MSRADSRVRSPGTFPCARCPAGTSALDAGPEACHNLAAVWWGVFAASVVIRDRVVIVRPLLVSSVNTTDARAPAWMIDGTATGPVRSDIAAGLWASSARE